MGGVFLGASVAKLILDKAASPHIQEQTFDWVLADFLGEVFYIQSIKTLFHNKKIFFCKISKIIL